MSALCPPPQPHPNCVPRMAIWLLSVYYTDAMYHQTKFNRKKISSFENTVGKDHIFNIRVCVYDLDLDSKTTFWNHWLLIMHHHTKFGYKSLHC